MPEISTAEAVRRVARTERIVSLDVMRGFAILAILAMNIPFMAGYAPLEANDPRIVSWTAADRFAFHAVNWFFDGAQRGLLELLFGAGIIIMARAAMTPDGQEPGRMPLTIYLSASILCMWILFPGVGFGLFGQYGWAGMQAIALTIMAGQLIFANVWMRSFETGPIDWLWKSLAYQKRQPFRRASAPAGAVAPAAAE